MCSNTGRDTYKKVTQFFRDVRLGSEVEKAKQRFQVQVGWERRTTNDLERRKEIHPEYASLARERSDDILDVKVTDRNSTKRSSRHSFRKGKV